MRNRLWKNVQCSLLCLLSVGFIAVGKAHGQANARLTGTVKDSSGAVVSGAAVTLTNQGTNISRTTTSDADGVYLFSLADVGKYTVTVEHFGFKKNVRTGVELEVNQNGRLDITLEVGQNTETVEVSAAVAQFEEIQVYGVQEPGISRRDV